MFSSRILYTETWRAYSTLEKFKSCFIRKKNINNLLRVMGISSKQIEYKQPETSQQSDNNYYSKFMKNLLFSVSITAGAYVILSLRKKTFFTNSLVPSAYAASPLHKPNYDNLFNKDGNNSDVKKDISKTYNFIADAAEKVADGVVFITVRDNVRRDYSGNPLVVSNGSGFIIESDGLIMTNAHVVGNKPRASIIVVKLADGREFEGKIEELDATSDLALVRISCEKLQSITLGSSKELRPGEFVVVMGSPLSLSNSVTSGVISSVGRRSRELGIGGPEIKYIQTDAAITFGNSGGPLINLDGEVIGINSLQIASGISFAIPVDYAKEFLTNAKIKKDFMSKRKSVVKVPPKRRRYLGITMFALSPEVILELQQRGDSGPKIPYDITHGILVWKVVGGSPSYFAGLTPGDIITHINGKKIHSIDQAYVILEAEGDLNMVVIRDGQRYAVSVAPEE